MHLGVLFFLLKNNPTALAQLCARMSTEQIQTVLDMIMGGLFGGQNAPVEESQLLLMLEVSLSLSLCFLRPFSLPSTLM
jgi:hypothetical protein